MNMTFNFSDSIVEQAGGKMALRRKIIAYSKTLNPELKMKNVDRIIAEVCKYFKIKSNELVNGSKRNANRKNATILSVGFILEFLTMNDGTPITNKKLAEIFKKDSSEISRMIKGYKGLPDILENAKEVRKEESKKEGEKQDKKQGEKEIIFFIKDPNDKKLFIAYNEIRPLIFSHQIISLSKKSK